MKKAVAMAYFLAGKGKIKHAALVAVCAGFGLRIGDALGLRWSTVFTEGGKIKERVTLTERKTKQSRTLKVLPWVRKILVEYYEAAHPSDHESPPVRLLPPARLGDHPQDSRRYGASGADFAT